LINGIDCLSRLETGSDKSIAPTKMIIAKPMAMVCAGESFILRSAPRFAGSAVLFIIIC